MNYKIYLAASFAFSDRNIAKERINLIDQAALILRNRGFIVFVPHEHKIPDGENMDNNIWAKYVMEMDKNALHYSEWVVILSFGKYGNNAGVAWEAGYAYGLKKHILIVKMNDDEESMMMWLNASSHIKGLDELKTFDFDKYIDNRIDGVELS